MKPVVEALFLAAHQGQRFALLVSPPVSPPRGLVLHLQPFAEELNKSRRNAVLAARALAKRGHAVLLLDNFGCGDSTGDFGEARWQDWLDDVALGTTYLHERFGRLPLWLWGTRTGCLLATEAARQALVVPSGFLFWQPVLAGKTFLQQFLRLKVAGEMLGGDAKGVMSALKRQLAAGEAVEIAGYTLSSSLARGVENAELAPPPSPSRVVWFEIASRPDASLSPAAQQRLELWQKNGHRVEAAVIVAPAFWQTVEIEEAPALITATVASLCQ